MPNKKTTLKLTLLITIFPSMVFANAGSPMMWFGLLHALFLNAIIGLTESYIVNRFKIPNRAWLIILANYVSMCIGIYYIAPYFSSISGNLDFWGGQTDYGDYHLKGLLMGMMTSYFATLVIEFPFFYYAVKNKIQRKQILFPFFVANTTTNIIMATVYFWIASNGGHW